ncbi:MAG: transcription elongation factor GreB, partial [Endozoicomonas sp.]
NGIFFDSFILFVRFSTVFFCMLYVFKVFMDSSPLITPAGKEALEEELQFLWRTRRPEVTQAVSEAAALGDRSENAEYKEGKRLLREIDRRIRYLTKRLEVLKVVEYSLQQEGKAFFGAWVEVENVDSEILRCRIVGADEIDVKKNHITIDSPMARALLGKEVNDEVIVKTPSGDKIWIINTIQYKPFD